MNADTIQVVVALIAALGGWEMIRYYINRKAEKRIKETEAETAEVDMAQKVQDTYEKILEAKDKEVADNHRLVEELRTDRDHYKQERDELRSLFDKLETEVREMKSSYETEKFDTDRKIARLGRKVEMLRPLLCGRTDCKLRQYVTISDEEDVDTATDIPQKIKQENEN